MIRSIAAGAGSNGAASSVIYAGTKAGFVWITRNAAAGVNGWPATPAFHSPGTNCNGGGCPVSDIALDPADSSGATAYLTVMGFQTPHIYKTADFGANWTDITANLPDVPANAVLVDPTNSDILYVGTDAGVFVSSDGGQSWNEHASGLPNVAVLQLRAYVDSTQLLRASTYGRGLWQAPLAQTVAPLPGQDFLITSQEPSLTVRQGQTGSAVISLATQNNFNEAVSFACSGLPVQAACAFTPGVLSGVLAGATTTVAISTGKTSTAQPSSVTGKKPKTPFGTAPYALWTSMPVFAITLWRWKAKRHRRSTLAWAIVALALAAFQFACGSAGSTASSSNSVQMATPTGNYTVTIVATSGSLQRTTTIALSVQ